MKYILAFIQNIFKSEYLALLFRCYIGYLFIYASLSKIPDPAIFAENVAAYQIIPYWGVNLVAIVLPMLELICGFFMIIGIRIKVVSTILGSLLFMFTVFVIINILRGSNISCGCFDTVDEPINWIKVSKNSIWFLMSIQVFFYDRINLFQLDRLFKWRKRNEILAIR